MPAIEDARVLVIGGAGFVGSHIVDQLTRRAGAGDRRARQPRARHARQPRGRAAGRPRVAGRGLGGGRRPPARPDGVATDYAFHLAALWLYECVHEPRRAIEANVVGTYNVVEAAHNAGVKKVVYSSSASVYGNAVEEPMTEEHPFNNRTMYGATKIAGEQFFRAFNEQHGLDYVGHRYMNIYGPRMDYHGAYVSVIMKVLDRLDAGQPPLIYGDGVAHLRLRPRRGRRARQHPVAEGRRHRHVLQRRHRRCPTTIKELVGHAAGDHGQRRRARVPARRRRCSSPTASAARSWPSGCWASAPRWAYATASSRSSSGGARPRRFGRIECLDRRPGGRHAGAADPDRQARPGRARARGRPEAAEHELARAGPLLPAVRGAPRGSARRARMRSATTSCTTALHLAVAVLGLEPATR